MGRGNLIGPIIVAIGVVVAAIAFAVVTVLIDTADGGTDLRLQRLEASAAELAASSLEDRARVEALSEDLNRLRDEMSVLANRGASAPLDLAPIHDAGSDDQIVTSDPAAQLPDEDFEGAATEDLTEQMSLAKTRFNMGVTQPRNRTMLEILGPPRDSFSQECQGLTNPRLTELLETRQIGPIKVTMLKPALDSLERILERLKASDPDIYAKVGTAGALCVRNIRGSSTGISNHSWATAIDLTLEGQLDGFADGGTQFGLLILAEYFNDEGWYWGAAYNREDSMHFEVGEETLRRWQAEGKL
ncbi:M15 family metallopeptidase [Xinfangfangia sp. CPCC 101601]|uniref:M15 family metallopeptidase n=1 Tax=Pseudogemmobacter lacusdianii TaxID=3069608 RepID=A0ABU0VVJ5_9RHOB|nr:M15 family metallopeptidase [Xinfangfangia sp. CPCC 101601]MDQ2065703.1 M15 family metallopeptidase [Xinfangfangia sp. CPCC 101601]